MKIPLYIQNKMHKIAKLHADTDTLMREVELYFESHGFDMDELRNNSISFFEELDYGNDITEQIVQFFEEHT